MIGAQINAIERAREQCLKAPPRVGKGTFSGRARTEGPRAGTLRFALPPYDARRRRATRAL